METRFKVIVAGCGNMSRTWLDYVVKRNDAEVVALVDLYPESARKRAREYQLTCPIYSDLTEAVRSTGANLVFDVTIPESHASIALTAMDLGCDVFAEKPLGTSMDEAGRMIAKAEETGRTLAIMQNRRYNKQIRAFRDMLSAGGIGQPGFVCVDFFRGPHFGGFREEMESPLILDMAIHTFDQARFLIQADPVSVTCHEFNPVGSWYRGNASAVCLFEFADGTVLSYRGSWCAEGASTPWESQWRIVGSRGTATWDGQTPPFCEIVQIPKGRQGEQSKNKTERIDSSIRYEGKEGHHGCLDEMFAALIEGRRPETDCRDNLKSVAMVYGALQSAREHRKVQL